MGALAKSTQRRQSSRVDSKKRRVQPGGENDAWPWDRVSGRRRQQPQRCEGHHFASILGLTFETLRASISGPSVYVPKLTLYETRNVRVTIYSGALISGLSLAKSISVDLSVKHKEMRASDHCEASTDDGCSSGRVFSAGSAYRALHK
jgi:hypothetical protein